MKLFKVVIPARYKSTRFPGKPLVKILGREMILHVLERAGMVVDKNQLLVATESEKIAELVQAHGYQSKLTLDTHPTGTDRVWEAIENDPIDFVINIQGDEPMFNPEDLELVIKAKYDFSSYVVNGMSDLMNDEAPENLNIPKLICNENNDLIYMSRNPIPATKEKTNVKINYKKQVCLYGFEKQHLEKFAKFGRKSILESIEDIEILRFFELGIPIKMIELKGNTKAVDVPEDVTEVERLLG